MGLKPTILLTVPMGQYQRGQASVAGEPHRRYDVIVVGAGPIGARVAELLAGRGVDTILIEEHARPGWPVQCAGLVTPRVFDHVPHTHTIQNRVHGAQIVSPSGTELVIRAETPRALVIDRSAFDQACVDAAVTAGAKVWLRTRATAAAYEPARRGVIVTAIRDGATHQLYARALVGADGVQSRVATWFGFPRPKRFVYGFQTELAVPHLPQRFDRTMVRMVTGNRVAPGFFAWLIPTDTTVLAGLCLLPSRAKPGRCARWYYDRLLEHPAVAPLVSGAAPIRVMAGGIPFGALGQTATDRVILVGDAAAQVKPTSGGGIYTGLRCADHCARALARALVRDDLSSRRLERYHRAWTAELGDELKKGWRLHKIYANFSDHDLERAFEILDEPAILETISKVGDIDHPSRLAAVLFRKAPKLLRFARPYFKSFWR